MDIMELGAIGELVGGIAVVASLVFVGFQLRHANHLAKGVVELEVGRMNMDYLRLGAEGEVAEIWRKGYYEPDTLSDAEKQRFVWSQTMWIHLVQAMYRQRERGLLPESSWQPLLKTLAGMLEDIPLLKEAWDVNAVYVGDDFRDFVDRERRENPSEGFWRTSPEWRPGAE